MTADKVEQLQMIEQNLQNFLVQKQNFQMQLMETDSALEELSKAEKAYKIVGGIMVASNKENLSMELEKKKEMMELRIKSIEKQEEMLKNKSKNLQEEVLKGLKE